MTFDIPLKMNAIGSSKFHCTGDCTMATEGKGSRTSPVPSLKAYGCPQTSSAYGQVKLLVCKLLTLTPFTTALWIFAQRVMAACS